MEFDLARGLGDLSRTPPVPPLPAEHVVHQVRRGRALRTAAVGLASAAVIAGAAAIVYAAPWQAPLPAETPAPAPTVEPTPELTPEPTPSPEETAADQVAPPIGLSVGGDLVELDPADGTVIRTIATDPAWSGPLAVDRERGHVYVTRDLGRDSDEWPGTVQRISINDGTVVDVDRGFGPALTQDGRTLAYVSVTAAAEAYAVTTVDVDSGATRTIVDSARDTMARGIGPLAWSADGTRIYVQVGWADAPFGELVHAVDPTTDTTFDDADSALRPAEAGHSWSRPAVLPDDRLVVTVSQPGPDYRPWWPESERVEWETGEPDSVEVFTAVVDPASGRVLERIDVPGADVDQVVAAGPDGRLAFIDTTGATWALHLSGPDGVREIGRGTWGGDDTVDVGIVAVAW